MQFASGSKLIDGTHVYWEIQWTEEPGRLQPTGLQRVRLDWSDWARTLVYYEGSNLKKWEIKKET